MEILHMPQIHVVLSCTQPLMLPGLDFLVSHFTFDVQKQISWTQFLYLLPILLHCSYWSWGKFPYGFITGFEVPSTESKKLLSFWEAMKQNSLCNSQSSLFCLSNFFNVTDFSFVALAGFRIHETSPNFLFFVPLSVTGHVVGYTASD